jgi:hypothetical protein
MDNNVILTNLILYNHSSIQRLAAHLANARGTLVCRNHTGSEPMTCTLPVILLG